MDAVTVISVNEGPAGSAASPNSVLSHASAVSWGAIAAGAAGAAALSLILLMLGIGLGLSSISPWRQEGVSASTFGWSAIFWITFTQIAASGLGGYLAGRLRTRWAGTHTDEVYFRDTAHGFLAWALATIVTAATLTSAIGAIVNSGLQATAVTAGAAVAGAGVAASATSNAPALGIEGGRANGNTTNMGYYIDSLFRKDAVTTTMAGNLATDTAQQAGSSAEVNRIFLNTIRTGPLSQDDVHYAGQVVAQRTGINQADAEKRVVDTYNRLQAKMQDAEGATKEAADKARKASTYATLWLFISLLIGAFTASLLAIHGGRRRDA